jgi:putative oxidoreductase
VAEYRALPPLAQRALAARRSPAVADCALVAARTALAWLFIYHGAGTLFGAFHGAGLHRTAAYFAATAGLRPGMFFAVLNGVTEFFGGIAIALGLATRLAAVGLLCDMVIAMITVAWHNGIVGSAAGSGYEINVALAALAVAVALLGAGRLSLDFLAGRYLAKRGLVPASSLPVQAGAVPAGSA